MDEALTEAERIERMERALARMSRRRRAIFLAVGLGGTSYADIAEHTGLTVRQVEREIAAALLQLDRAIHDDPSDRWRPRWFSFLGGRDRP